MELVHSRDVRQSAVPVREVDVAALQRHAQAKLRVGASDDRYEREADGIAALAVRSLHGGVRFNDQSAATRIRRRAAGDATSRSATEELLDNASAIGCRIRRGEPGLPLADDSARRRPSVMAHGPGVQLRSPIGRAGGDLDADTEQVLNSARRGGSALSAPVQRRLGDIVGADLSRVRLHEGDTSRELNERMSAQAFTVGNDVFFRDGVPDTNSPSGLGLVAHEVAHTVQQGAAPVTRRVQVDQDAPAGSEAEESEESEAEAETETEAETIPAGEVEMSGTLPDVVEPVRPEDIAGLGNREEDSTSAPRTIRASEATRAASASRAMPVSVDASVGTKSSVRQGGGAIFDEDTLVGGTITANGNISGPVPTTDAFGAMATDIKFSGVDWKFAKGKISVDLTIDGSYEWEVHGGSCIDISGPDSPLITAENYEEMSEDLTPKKEGSCWRPARETYWSEALTTRHEKYHAEDAKGWVNKKGPGVVRNYLKKNPIDLTETERKDKSAVTGKVQAVVDEALDAVIEGRRYYFRKNISDYLKYPGEIRAFGDGKKPYADLAKGIKTKGKTLAKAKAVEAKASTGKEKTAKTDEGTT